MNPILSVRLEIWESSEQYLKHGLKWYEKILMFLFNRGMYRRINSLSTGEKKYIRGFYNRFQNTIAMCAKDIEVLATHDMRHEGPLKGDYHRIFGLMFYFTMIHEMIHKMNVAIDDVKNGGHTIDYQKLSMIDPQLKDIFEGLLELEMSRDAFQAFHEEAKMSGKI